MKFLFFFVLAFSSHAVQAQSDDLPEIAGKIKGQPENGIFKQLKSNTPAFRHLNISFTKFYNATMVSGLMTAPSGYDVKFAPYISDYLPQFGHKRYKGGMTIFLFSYYKDKSGKWMKTPEAPATINFYINPVDFFTDEAGFFESKDEKFHLPHPFQKIPVIQKDNYVSYSFRSYPFPVGYFRDFEVRVVKGNNRELFIPFSRKQYLEYLIAMEKLKIQDSDEKILDFEKSIAEAKKTLADKEMKEEYKKFIPQSIQSLEAAISAEKKYQDQMHNKMARYQKNINGMPPDVADAVAYVDLEQRALEENGHLVAPGRREGWPLYIVNPDYYDNSAPPQKIQAIIVTYWMHNLFCPDGLKKKTKQIFEAIDYRLLRESIQ